MYLFAILSSLLCIQLISSVTSVPLDTSDASSNVRTNLMAETPTIVDNEELYDDDDDVAYVPRSAQFLRFGRQAQAFPSAAFLRFGRSNPSFLRFGRGDTNAGTFLRFGRQAPSSASSNFLRFGRKGEFLRFG